MIETKDLLVMLQKSGFLKEKAKTIVNDLRDSLNEKDKTPREILRLIFKNLDNEVYRNDTINMYNDTEYEIHKEKILTSYFEKDVLNKLEKIQKISHYSKETDLYWLESICIVNIEMDDE